MWDITGRDDVVIAGGAGMVTCFRCVRCAADLGAVEITTFGDRESRYVPGVECACPGPRCPWCRRRLDDDGCCPSTILNCWAGGLVIPIPDVA